MNKRELTEYHSELAGILKSEPNRSKREEFIAHERTTDQYKFAKEQARLRNSIKSILPVVVCDLPDEDRTEGLVDRLVTIIWSKEVLNQYNDLPKANSQERKKVNNLVAQTAERLLKNPQDINIAEKAWRTNETEQDEPQETQEPFSELVKKECASLIKEKWEAVTPGQLAQLVRISAEGLLRNYFKGPKSRRERGDAYYTLVSATLDLVGDDKAFNVAVKIGFHATDILPRDPSLIEQSVLLSLPYGEDEKVFQKLLIARYVLNQIGFMSSEDIVSFHRENSYFVRTNEKAIMAWNRKRKSVTTKIGPDVAREFSDIVMRFFDISQRPLSEGVKQSLKDTWPYSVAFDETDPLNKKFQEVFPRIAALKTESPQLTTHK